jgi:hypothetical protein
MVAASLAGAAVAIAVDVQMTSRMENTNLIGMTLTKGDLAQAFNTPNNPYDPILDLKTAAALAKIAPSTLKRLVSEGRFADCVKRGKPLLFWRDAFVRELMK